MADQTSTPSVVDASQISSSLSYPLLVDRLRSAFSNSSSIVSPPRHHHTLPSSSALLLMPAWSLSPSSPYLGVKIVSVFPHNACSGLPSVSAFYFLSSALTGLPLAVLDGKEITLWRTACVSALAADYLARNDSRVLLMVGAGSLAPHLIRAHLSSRPSIQKILIWNRTGSKATLLAEALSKELTGKEVQGSLDLESAVRSADVISCATLSEKPLVLGCWLKPGTHLDLVGSFNPSMKECDEDAIRKGRVYIDTWAASQEAGELQDGMPIEGTLTELASGEKLGRQHAQEVTVFKSVGCALVDLATAQLVYERKGMHP